MDLDIPPSSSASSSTGSTDTSRKFKLDPMSLLLPHEREAYQQQQRDQQRAMREHQKQQQLAQQLRHQQAAEEQGFYSGSGHQAWEATVRSSGPVAAKDTRQTSSMGDQSGRQGDPQLHRFMPPPPPPVTFTQNLPLSPPPSIVSTPPPSWDAMSIASSAGAYASIGERVEASSVSSAREWARRQQAHQHTHPPQSSRGYTFGTAGSVAMQAQTSGKARLADWEIVETLGTGTFGRVLLVRQRPNYRPTPYHPIFPHLFQSLDPLSPSPSSTQQADGQLPHFAMKVLRKSEIVRLKQVEHINSERAILGRIRHPFVVELYATYQDTLNVYMLLSYIPGGELFSHLRRAGRFSADVTRFYLASIILAIDYLHSNNIIYRDLKPENLLLDRVGYLRIADFGFAKLIEDRTYTLCGTPEYLAPEIVLSQGHGKAVDWWALGILAFEMLAGYPPFFDDHTLGIYEKILRNEIAFPSHIDPYAKEMIRGLLTADRSKRLGNLRGGAKDVMKHAWFAGVDWGSLERKEIGAPIVPRVASMGDSQNFQRYPPPKPAELPGIFGKAYEPETDQYAAAFAEFEFPGHGQGAMDEGDDM